MKASTNFYIGSTHLICEDYAAHGEDVFGNPFIAVSDGCSSVLEADIGSRLLVKSTSYFMSKIYDNVLKPNFIISDAKLGADAIHLSYESLNATLMLARIQKKKIAIDCFGDGVIIKVRKDDVIEVTQIEYSCNAPFYLLLASDPERAKNYQDNVNFCRINSDFQIENGEETCIETKMFSLKDYHNELLNISDYSTIALFTDGIYSFATDVVLDELVVPRCVQLPTIIKQLFAMGGPMDANSKLKDLQILAKNNKWYNLDDVGMGVLYIGN